MEKRMLEVAISKCGSELKPFSVDSVSFLLHLSRKVRYPFIDLLRLKLCVNCDFIYLEGIQCPKCVSGHFAYVVYWDLEEWLPAILHDAFDFDSIL